ncbi:MAG: GDSL-type esterase/lipase family protein [Negativicutes bacterium]|nr:GDSL-type esterase/lipase family protein [Negativicutes bacterium]
MWENIALTGRWLADGHDRLLGWGCGYLTVNFCADSLTMRVDDRPDVYWQYRLDGGCWHRHNFFTGGDLLVTGEGEVCQLQLFRRSEGVLGTSRLRPPQLAAGGRLLPVTVANRPFIEFVGDSITAGFRNSGPGWEDQDSWHSYAGFLARMLDADWATVAVSGVGVVRNYAEERPWTAVHLADYYCRALPDDRTRLWQTDRPADLVVLAVGTNDFSCGDQPAAEEFVAGYVRLIDRVRRLQPDAHVAVTEPLPAWAGDICRPWLENMVAERRRHDRRLLFVPVNHRGPLLTAGDFVDGDTHPGVGGGRKFAEFLAGRLERVLRQAGTDR